MKTESRSIHDVLALNATSFFIPPFQRAYAWGKPEIERYFSDVLRIVRSELDTNQTDKLEHFFGTLVIKNEGQGFSTKSVVIDGQQRLTTILIFLIALRDTKSNKEEIQQINQTYLTNHSSTFQDKIKLKQVTKDWDAYKALVKGEELNQPSAISNAYRLLKNLINQESEISFNNYLVAITRMNVAVIFLDERPFKGEDPQIIFETLNSLGKPLTLADLVRNFVLLNMQSENQSNIYEQEWHPKIEKVLGEDTSKFFRDYLQYKKNISIKSVSDNNTKELYQQFKEFVEEKFITDKNAFISDIVRYVPYYKWIITEINNDTISENITSNQEIKELLRNIFHDIEAEAFKPFVLGLLECYRDGIGDRIIMSDEILILTLTAIRTYLIRRRILGLGKGENKNIVRLVDKIVDIAQGKNLMFDLLSNMFYDLRLPNDSDMKSELARMDFYNELKKYAKFILGKIEEQKSKVSVDFRNERITIEHIMPRKLNDSWKNELGENFEEIHNNYVNNIGNLILTEFNSEIGNRSFAEKKKILRESALTYRLDIIERNVWDVETIQSHQLNMIQWFLETFSVPEKNKAQSNWNTQTRTITSDFFSPMDEDIIVEGNKPVELKIFNSIIKVNSWQDVFIKFLKYLYEKPNEYVFEDIFNTANQYEMFAKQDTILRWISFRELIRYKPVLISRYKTFEGKSSDKVKELNDDLWFIHINMSASTCVQRIRRIMEKLFLQNESIQIKLKPQILQ